MTACEAGKPLLLSGPGAPLRLGYPFTLAPSHSTPETSDIYTYRDLTLLRGFIDPTFSGSTSIYLLTLTQLITRADDSERIARCLHHLLRRDFAVVCFLSLVRALTRKKSAFPSLGFIHRKSRVACILIFCYFARHVAKKSPTPIFPIRIWYSRNFDER